MARNRRSTASALLGLVLGVAVVSAPWVAVDSSIRGLFNSYLDGVEVDVYAFGAADNVANATTDLARVPNVNQVVPTYQDFGLLNSTGGANSSFLSVDVHLIGSSFEGVMGRLGLSWSAAPGRGTIVVPSTLTALSVGDIVAIEGHQLGRSSRYSVAGFYNLTSETSEFRIDSVFLSSDDLARYQSDLNLSAWEPRGVLFAWLDRGALIDSLDPGGTSARLQRQKVLMENALLPSGYFVSYGGAPIPLSAIPQIIESRSFFLRIGFTAMTVPSLILALLLTRVGFDVGLAPRRRELAVLRSRGLSVRGVRAFLAIEAAVLALVGGALGLAVGVALSRLFLGAVLADAPGPAPLADFAVTSSTVAFALAFGTLLGFGSSWRGIRLLAKEDIVSVLKAHHEEEVAIPHRVSRDFLIGSVAAVGILLLLTSASLKGSPLSFLSFILGLSTTVLAPIAPFLLTIAVARYLTRGTTRPYRALARLLRPALGEMYPLVEKNLVRSPRRSSNLAVIVTFAIGFVLAVLMISASSEAYRLEGVLRSTPADVVVEWNRVGVPRDNLTEALSVVRAVPGVAAVVPVLAMSTNRGTLVAFDAAMYLDIVPWLAARHLGGIDPRTLMAALSVHGTFAANTNLASPLGLQIGDSVFVQGAFGGDVSARLVAVVPAIPGLYYNSPDDPFRGYLYMDFGSLPPDWNASESEQTRFLIRTASGADSETVGDAVARGLGSFASFRTLDGARRAELANPAANLFFGFLLSQGELAVAILVFAIGLFVFSAAAGRREELATLVARGFRTRAVAALLMGEGWVVTILGILLGVFAALITLWTVLEIATVLNPTPISVPFVIPAAVLLPLGLVVLGVFAAGWLGTFAVRRMDVVSVLKMRGG